MKSNEEIFEHFIGPKGSPRRTDAEETLENYPGRTLMAEVLFRMHTHGEICDPHEIVYQEADIVRLLEFLGYPIKFGGGR